MHSMPNGEQALEQAQEGEDSAEDIAEWDSQGDDEEEESKELIKKLREIYEEKTRGLRIDFLGNKIKLTTKREHKDFYKKLIENKETNTLSNSALETLAIIAYNRPITRLKVDELRGISSAQIVRKLVAKGLIKETGRSLDAGRPILYNTTSEFLDYFGMSTIEELPDIQEFLTKREEEKEVDLYNSKYKEK